MVILCVPEIPRDGPELQPTGPDDQHGSDKWHNVDHSVAQYRSLVQRKTYRLCLGSLTLQQVRYTGRGNLQACGTGSVAGQKLPMRTWGYHTLVVVRSALETPPGSCHCPGRCPCPIFTLPRRLRALHKPQILGLIRQIHKAAHQAVAVALAGVHVHVELA